MGQNTFLDSELHDETKLVDGIGLCMSGGGYRATLFHIGSLLRLNEVGLLSQLQRISSVSGGSITAGALGLVWNKLHFASQPTGHRVASNLLELLVPPLRQLTSTTIDRSSVLSGVLLPGWTVSDFIIRKYREIVFGDSTLQSLPRDDQGPRFIFNATNVQTGSLVRFSRPYLADYRVGQILNPKIPLAEVVAASSAFPPVLSPVHLDVNTNDFVPDTKAPLQKLPYTDTMVLSDGGVYDNLGMETVVKRYRTVLVSDAGAKFQAEPSPAANWAEHAIRILGIIDNQVRSLRKRALIESYLQKERTGAYWGINSNVSDFELAAGLPTPFAATQILAETPTRLRALDITTQNRLMNWGYAITDVALRKHVSDFLPKDFPAPTSFPFADGVG